MLRRTRNHQREIVAVELVDPLPIDSIMHAPNAAGSTDGRHHLVTVDGLPPTTRSTDLVGDEAAGDDVDDGDDGDDGAVGLSSADVDDGADSPEASEKLKRPRSIRWAAVVLIATLLVGVVGWMLTRDPSPSDTLPWIPADPSARYSWRVDGTITDDVSVYGTPDRAYVIATTDASITIDALDAQGNPRWSTDLDPGWATGLTSTADGNVLVITDAEPAVEDVGTRSWTTTLTLIDDDTGEIVWQTNAPGAYAGNIGNRVMVSDQPSNVVSTGVGEDGEMTDSTTAETVVVTDPPDGSGFDIRVVDTTTGKVAAPQHFDQVSYPAGSESDSPQFTAPAPERASFVAARDGEAYMLSPDLQPASTPVKVGTDAQLGFDGEHLLVIDDGVATSYDEGGREVASGPISDIVGTEQVTTQGHGNGIWTYSAVPEEGFYSEGASSDRPQWTCGAFRLDDAGVTGLWQRNDCFVWSSARLDDGTTVTFVYDFYSSSFGPNNSTIVNLDDGAERTDGLNVTVGANGFVVERKATLLLTSLASAAPRAEIELAFNARWFLLDGGIAVIEPNNDGAANAVSVTMYR